MSTQTILVIDDSSTIRKMVDSHLTQEGYRVVLAPTAEKGLELAPQLQPDLILLDHQLPGTTGIEVCRKIISDPRCVHIPFVVSSTLRKQAYIEYMDVPNVVDSLPKPFKPELLKSTVANAIEVGAMIVSSQTDGTAVPEVVGEVADSSMAGDFSWVSLRELIDFLNNGNKKGMLEVELEHDRVWFYLDEGRIQTVVSASISPDYIAARLPEALIDLAPLLRFTMSSGFTSQIEGFVELLDRKVLDPRMLRTLLRFQAAVLTRYCLKSPAKCFNFYAGRDLPPLFRRTPLQSSLAGLLVEAAVHAHHPAQYLPHEEQGWLRRALRGQNLDRSGLNAKHLQMLSQLGSEAISTAQLAAKVDLPPEEVERILEGFQMADWVSRQKIQSGANIAVLESDSNFALLVRDVLEDDQTPWNGKVVRDEFGLQLLLNRNSADLLLVNVTGSNEYTLPACLRDRAAEFINKGALGIIIPEGGDPCLVEQELQDLPTLIRPYNSQQLTEAFHQLQSQSVRRSSTKLDKSSQADAELLATGQG